MIRIAPASRGKPKWKASSTVCKITPSIISSAAGTMPEATMSETHWVASSMVSKIASRVRTAWAWRVSRTVAWVTMPNVPSEPTASPSRS